MVKSVQWLAVAKKLKSEIESFRNRLRKMDQSERSPQFLRFSVIFDLLRSAVVVSKATLTELAWLFKRYCYAL